MHCKQKRGAGGGQGEIGGEGVAGAAEKVAGGADGEEGKRTEEQGPAEQTHRGRGEVREVAEREVVALRGVGEKRGDVGAGCSGAGGAGEESRGKRKRCADREEEPARPGQGAQACEAVLLGTIAIGTGEGAADEQGERGQCGKGVVLLPGGEGEEAEHEHDPETEREGGLAAAGGGDRGAAAHIAQTLAESAGKEGHPRNEPERSQ